MDQATHANPGDGTHDHPRRHYPRLNKILVVQGFWTSWLFAGLILITPILYGYLHPYHKWIGLGFLVSQLIEILARNHLNKYQVFLDHGFSLGTAVLGIVWVVIWRSGGMGSEGWEVLRYFVTIAWIDAIFGIAISFVILNAPYQREESPPD